MELVLALAIGVLTGSGVWLLLKRRLAWLFWYCSSVASPLLMRKISIP